MSFSFSLPPLPVRLAAGRPVMTREQLLKLSQQIMAMSSADLIQVFVSHKAQVVIRMANNRVLFSDDGDAISISIGTRFGSRTNVTVRTNQIDEAFLRALVRQCEALTREKIGALEVISPVQRQTQDTYVPVQLWHDETIRAMSTVQQTVIPDILNAVAREKLSAAGFLGLVASADAIITSDGVFAFNEETDCELTVTARNHDGKSSGWGGQAARNWAKIRPADVTAQAIDFAKRSANPVALEPGRRTAILGPAAVAQMLRYLSPQFDAYTTDVGNSGFSKIPRGNKTGQRVFDTRISMRSDPNDPDGGYSPYFFWGLGTPAMTWVDNGILKNLAYGESYAMGRGKAYADMPWSLRVSGGPTTIPQMISRCAEGIYVNRVSSVDLMDQRTCLITGVTRDGCFLVKDGKIDRPVKNFRFLTSPFFFLNNIEALGASERTAFGYTPRGRDEGGPAEWPRRPMIVPPMMVRDFNFNALSDAV